jgi:hypothetical protein
MTVPSTGEWVAAARRLLRAVSSWAAAPGDVDRQATVGRACTRLEALADRCPEADAERHD